MALTVVALDESDEIWWEMPEDMRERLMRAETTNELAVIARQIRDAVKHADEQAARNT